MRAHKSFSRPHSNTNNFHVFVFVVTTINIMCFISSIECFQFRILSVTSIWLQASALFTRRARLIIQVIINRTVDLISLTMRPFNWISLRWSCQLLSQKVCASFFVYTSAKRAFSNSKMTSIPFFWTTQNFQKLFMRKLLELNDTVVPLPSFTSN